MDIPKELIFCGIALLTLIVATICDLTTHKIPNWLTFPILLLGLFVTCKTSLSLTKELGIFLGVFFILGCIGVTGWGDIKCVMAIGALVGWLPATSTFVIANICLFLRYLVFTPKKAASEFGENAKQVVTGSVAIDQTKPTHLFAPFLLVGYIITAIIFCGIYFLGGAA